MTKDLAPKHHESSGGQSPKSSNPGEKLVGQEGLRSGSQVASGCRGIDK